jgi:Family of unknown function (DUF6325)
MRHGAVEFVVIEFNGQRLDPSLAASLREQVSKGVITVIDLLFVQKNTDGSVRSFELDEVSDDGHREALGGIAQAIDGLISPEDVSDVAAGLEPGTTALIVLFEHIWLRELRAAVERSHGRVVFAERIPGEIVDAVENFAKAAA